jgi:hypothetical protein
MSGNLEFEIDESILWAAGESATERPSIPAIRRKYDPALVERGRAAAAKLKERFQAELASLISADPEAFRGLNMSLEVKARAKSTAGAYKVLFSLIDFLLGPSGATSTQDVCRATVQKMHPDMAVSKDWTRPLPDWAVAHAKTRAPLLRPNSPVIVKRGMSLRDLHNAVRIASAKAGGEARPYRASVSITTDAVFINDIRFKVSVNKSNGREYAIARVNVDALEAALKS